MLPTRASAGRRDQGGLQDVLGALVVAGHQVGGPEQRGGVGAHELGEPVLVALLHRQGATWSASTNVAPSAIRVISSTCSGGRTLGAGKYPATSMRRCPSTSTIHRRWVLPGPIPWVPPRWSRQLSRLALALGRDVGGHVELHEDALVPSDGPAGPAACSPRPAAPPARRRGRPRWARGRPSPCPRTAARPPRPRSRCRSGGSAVLRGPISYPSPPPGSRRARRSAPWARRPARWRTPWRIARG